MEECSFVPNPINHISHSQQCSVCYIDVCRYIDISDYGKLENCYDGIIIQVEHLSSQSFFWFCSSFFLNLNFTRWNYNYCSIFISSEIYLYPCLGCFWKGSSLICSGWLLFYWLLEPPRARCFLNCFCYSLLFSCCICNHVTHYF